MTTEEIDAFEGLRIFLAAIPTIDCPGCPEGSVKRKLEPELDTLDQYYDAWKQAVIYSCPSCKWRREAPIDRMLM